MVNKGLWIFQMDISDPEAYKTYQEEAGRVLKQYGARFLVRGGRGGVVEGKAPSRTVVIEFEDYDTAVACWNSPEYIASKAFRQGNAVGNIIIAETYRRPRRRCQFSGLPAAARYTFPR